jgi:5S rRNA maturation endonuclease (ribonuclease M5)
MSLVIDTISLHLPSRRKKTPSGWISFNAVCCHHNGTSSDTRQRGGMMINEGVSYHCFNCGFKTSWQPGRIVTTKFRKLMRWLNVPDDLISKCSLEALRLKENSDYKSKFDILPKFIDKILPPDSVKIGEAEYHDDMNLAIEYIANRGFYLDDYEWYWSPAYPNRLIVPFYFNKNLVGFTARLLRDGKPKYISEQQPGYVFNFDNQKENRKYVIVCEGPFDAISIDGVAILGSEISDQQKTLINQLKREVIILPDRDSAGKKLVDQAIENNWSVSFPNWDPDIKDANEALLKYGRLATLYSIIRSKETSGLKIKLLSKKWFEA